MFFLLHMTEKENISAQRPYAYLISSIGQILEEGRRKAIQSINQILVKTYWEIGRRIVKYEQKGQEKAIYGISLLRNLSRDLTLKYGKGFSEDNLEKMRRFYLFFKNSETLSRKLSWSHYCLLIRIRNATMRNFYAIETEKTGWSVRELERQINAMLFERLIISKDKKEILRLSKKGQIIQIPKDIIKDPYILDFLGLDEASVFTESHLEQKIIDALERFLLELGKGFTFVERQKRITIEDHHFYIDLVFYHRLLRCFVLIELKVGTLTHKDLGQLQMYVNYYDRVIRNKQENPTIGILLCADKKEAIVKYTLPMDNKQIFASEYKFYLPDKKMLQDKLKEILEYK